MQWKKFQISVLFQFFCFVSFDFIRIYYTLFDKKGMNYKKSVNKWLWRNVMQNITKSRCCLGWIWSCCFFLSHSLFVVSFHSCQNTQTQLVWNVCICVHKRSKWSTRILHLSMYWCEYARKVSSVKCVYLSRNRFTHTHTLWHLSLFECVILSQNRHRHQCFPLFSEIKWFADALLFLTHKRSTNNFHWNNHGIHNVNFC